MMSKQDTQTNVSNSDWCKCPEGELQRMVGRLNFAAYCVKCKKCCVLGITGVVLIAGVVVLGTVALRSGDSSLTCAECQGQFEAYYAYLSAGTEMADPQLADRMQDHLANCQACRQQFESTYPGTLTSDIASWPGHSVGWHLPPFAVTASLAATPAVL